MMSAILEVLQWAGEMAKDEEDIDLVERATKELDALIPEAIRRYVEMLTSGQIDKETFDRMVKLVQA